MPRRPVELPDNLPDCHAIILRQAERIEQLEARVDELTARIDELMAEVRSLKRELYGPRRERFVPNQTDAPPPAALPAFEAPSAEAEPKPPRTSAGRRPR